MFITADQILAHAIGDYLLQSDWMAQEKTKSNIAASAHAFTYTLPFYFLASTNVYTLAFVCLTHFLIDRFRLARYLVYAKNFLGRREYWYIWEDCSGTGYHKDRPSWLSVWLLIIADNTMHLVCNGLAVKLFG